MDSYTDDGLLRELLKDRDLRIIELTNLLNYTKLNLEMLSQSFKDLHAQSEQLVDTLKQLSLDK